jgi:acetyltransferase
MTVRNLEYLFRPGSVAVIGASDRPHSVGKVVMRNLLDGGFAGSILPVNPKHGAVGGVLTYPDVASLPLTPDLAVICTPSATVPELIADLGARGTRAAVVLSAGLSRTDDDTGRTLQQSMLDSAKPHLLRILGPNCIGQLIPGIGLNASFAHIGALAGHIAFVSQSGALCTAVLDWAQAKGIGFSHFISLGNSADVDFGDVIDYLAGDPSTRAILLYIESVRHARKFMSAVRAAARNKTVVAIKSGRAEEGARAAASHTGALAGADDVYDAALRRAGVLRVESIEELFEATETLARARPMVGDRLAVLTNGGGPGVMAVDALIAAGGRLAKLSDDTVAKLIKVLPETWSRGNPIDIIGDAPPARYARATEILLQDIGVDAMLIMYAPTAITSSVEAARTVIASIKDTKRNVLTCWLGQSEAQYARRLFAEADIPTYETPERAVSAFTHMIEYRRNQEMLLETPQSVASGFVPDVAKVRQVIDDVLTEGRDILTEPEAKEVLAAYGVPIVETRAVGSIESVGLAAEQIGLPVALKVLSPDITHKSDVGGVALDLESAEAAKDAARAMTARVAQLRPDARVVGFTVQAMARRPGAHELIVGVATDPIFGPVILFGQGGTAVEIIGDQAVALPPLNLSLAGDLISRTRVSRLLAGYRDRPTADFDALKLTLTQVSQLIVDVPEIVELDINPLFADQQGVLALDARIGIQAAAGKEPTARLAIRPYPKALEEEVTLKSGHRVLLRPIRPEDEPEHSAFFKQLVQDDVYFRFFGAVRQMPHSQLARYTQIDYDREMAFIATGPGEDGGSETYGVVRTVCDPDNTVAEFAIIVRSDKKGQGLGQLLTDKIIRYCRARGTIEIVGQALRSNYPMLKLARAAGFHTTYLPEQGVVEIRLKLRDD